MEEKKSLIPALQTDVEQPVEQDAWEHQPGEHFVWYNRFNQYRLLGPNRSLREAHRQERAAAKKLQIKNKAIPLGTVQEWTMAANRWEWEARALAWDEYIQQQQETNAQRVFGEGLALVHNRVDALKQLAENLKKHIDDPNAKRLSPYIIEQYRKTMEDIALEMGQRKQGVTVTGPNNGPIRITTEWGRGGSASSAWDKVGQNVITELTEKATATDGHEQTSSEGQNTD